MANNILKNPMVKKLIETFDLQPPLRTEHTLNVLEYTFENGFIVIHEIELLDRNGNHVRNIEPDDEFSAMDQFIVTFRIKNT